MKTHHNTSRFFLIVAIFFTVIFGWNKVGYSQEEKVLYVVSVNDQHGNIDNYPQFAALLDSLRNKYGEFLLISAGDNRTGHPVNDKYPKISYPITALMNEVEFDFSALGNHEFDAGIDGLKNVAEWAKFDFLCANAKFEDSSINVLPYKIVEYKGLKLGFIGGIQIGNKGIPDFHSAYAKGITFNQLSDVLPEYMFLRDECDALFLISHCGFETDIEIAKKFPEFDAIFGGHTHKKIERTKSIGNTMITQSGKNLNYLTMSVFYFINGKIDYKAQQIFSIKDFGSKDAEIQKIVDEFNSLEIFSKVVGYNNSDISEKEKLGFFMADVIREYADADISLQNPGGVRLSKMNKGDITLKQIYQLDPFDNQITKFYVKGEEIVEIFRKAFTESEDFPLFCSGCTYKIIRNEYEEFENVEIFLPNGKPLKMNAKYSLVMNDYMANVFNLYQNHKSETLDKSSNEITIEYLNKHKNIDYQEVRRIFNKELLR